MKTLSITFTDQELTFLLLVILLGLVLIGAIGAILYSLIDEDEDIETEELIQAWKNSKKRSKQ